MTTFRFLALVCVCGCAGPSGSGSGSGSTYGQSVASAEEVHVQSTGARIASAEAPRRSSAPRPRAYRQVSTSSVSEHGAERKLRREAWLTYEYGDDGDRAARARQVTRLVGQWGGYVSFEAREEMVLRVPGARLEGLLNALAKLGTVVDRGTRTVEVTRQYYDLAGRIESHRRLQARLRTLLERAVTVQDVLSVERELTRVTAQLESLEGQFRVMANRIALATVTVRFRHKVSPGPLGWIFVGLYEGIKWLFVWD